MPKNELSNDFYELDDLDTNKLIEMAKNCLFSEKNYLQTLKIAEILLSREKRQNFYIIKGLACYSEKKYIKAKRSFEEACAFGLNNNYSYCLWWLGKANEALELKENACDN